MAQPVLVVDVQRGLTGLPDALADRIRRDHRGHEQINVVDIDTDMCVLKIAMDIFDLGIEPLVYVDCCASTAGLQAHLNGLAVLSRNVGPHQLRLTRLHEGYLAGGAADGACRPRDAAEHRECQVRHALRHGHARPSRKLRVPRTITVGVWSAVERVHGIADAVDLSS